MPVYQYRALTPEGRREQGVVDADTPKDARMRLRERRLVVTELVPLEPGGAAAARQGLPAVAGRRRLFGRGRRLQELSLLTRQLATLLNSGIPIMGALTALVEQAEHAGIKAVLMAVRERVSQGAPFSEALAGHPALFNELYVNMVRAGEASGALDAVLFRLADYLQTQNRLHNRIVAAMTYPMIVMIVGIAVLMFLLAYVVPRILELIKQRRLEDAIPLPTQILLGISNFMSNWWWLVVGAGIGGYFAFRAYVRTERGRMWWHGFLLRAPVLGPLFRKAAISRFAVTLATLLESGLPVLESLTVVRAVVNNRVLEDAIETVRKRISEGADIATPLKATKIFPPVVTYMVAVGEESGQLERLLRKISEAYDEEVEIAAQRMTSVLEPLMIVALAVVVGFIVLSILLPILQITKI